MDLWIRAQNGRLAKIDDIMQPIEDEFDDIKGWVLYSAKQSGAMHILGIYKTEERAIEVLDEIQEHRDVLLLLELMPNSKKIQGIKEFQRLRDSLTYEMPKE